MASLPPLTGVLEAAVYVDDLDSAARFYGDLLGLEELVRVEGRHLFYRCGSTVVLCFVAEATEQPPEEGSLPVPPHGARGRGHICFSLASEALDACRAGLEEAGIEIESDFHWPHGPRSVYVRDPAGNSVEFSEPALWDMAKMQKEQET